MQFRSSSVPRSRQNSPFGNFYDNPPRDANTSRLSHQRGPSRDQAFNNAYNNVSMNAGKEILRSGSHYDQQRDPSPVSQGEMGMDYIQERTESRAKAPNNWRDYVNEQSQGVNRLIENERNDKKLRALKYKEALDKMRQNEQEKKAEERREFKQMPNVNPEEMAEYARLERMKQEEDKRAYKNELEKLRNEKEEIKRREAMDRQQERDNYQKMVNHAKEYEQLTKDQDNMNKKMLGEEYKQMMGQKFQVTFLRVEEILKISQKNTIYQKNQAKEMEYQYFLNDDERKRHYEKIYSAANRGARHHQNILEAEYEKQKRYNDMINKQMQDKHAQESWDMARRQEQFKERQRETLLTNQQQIAEKSEATRKRREEYQQNVKNGYQDREILQQMDEFEKQRHQEQRRDYMESLKSQMNARNQSMISGNQLTAAERLVNFRRQDGYLRNEQDAQTSLPFVGQSHERSKQLRYLDKWLNFVPNK